MEQLGFGINDESTTYDQEQTNQQESSLLSIQRCIKCLVHSSQCMDVNCQFPTCQKMKNVVQHAKYCRQKNTVCPICKQLLAICLRHAKNCQMPECPVSFCLNIKNRIKHNQLQKRLQQAHILKRLIATMQNCVMSGAMLQTSSRTSNSSSQPSPAAQPHSSPQPGQQSSEECIICNEKTVDCALYRCGHTCMCYNCAFKLWKSNSSSHCPICRSSIQDVIKNLQIRHFNIYFNF